MSVKIRVLSCSKGHFVVSNMGIENAVMLKIDAFFFTVIKSINFNFKEI